VKKSKYDGRYGQHRIRQRDTQGNSRQQAAGKGTRKGVSGNEQYKTPSFSFTDPVSRQHTQVTKFEINLNILYLFIIM